MLLVYLSGPAGAGKTTLMRALTERCTHVPMTNPFAHDVLMSGKKIVGAQLGKERGTFSGTDALSMSVQPKAIEWLKTTPYPLILGEGMRLATKGFFLGAQAAGYRVVLVNLEVRKELTKARRAQRGTDQDEKFIKASYTRAANLAQEAPAALNQERFQLVTLYGETSPAELAAALCVHVPALGVLL